MPRLTARYEAELPVPILLHADRMSTAAFSEPVFDQGRLSFPAVIDGLDVLLTVSPDHGAWTGMPDGTALLGAVECIVEVSREGEDELPGVVATPSGGRDLTNRVPYFQARAPLYGAVATICLRRLLSFIRFRLGQPLIWGSGDSPPRLIHSTAWLDAAGNPVSTGFQALGVSIIGHRDREWQSAALAGKDEPALRSALESEPNVPLHYLIVAQGKDAAIEGDLRRAVMELAIASEIAVKQAFFSPATAAGEAFEYLEDKNLYKVGAIELLGEPSRRAFGEGFKDYDAVAFEHLDYLFRCRNKVVHRGQLVYRDQSGIATTPDRVRVRAWLGAVLRLFKWLEARAGLPGVA